MKHALDAGHETPARTRRLGAIAVGAVALLTYAPALRTGFVWDDAFQVQRNPWIRDPGQLGQAFTRDLAGFLPGYETSYYRPLVHVLHAAVFAAGGPEPWAFHLANLLLHAAAGVCLFLLLARWTSSVGPPLLAALLFAVHPIHTEPVIWITGVIEVAYSLLVLIALLALTSGRRRWWAAVPPLLALALLWKEPAAALVPIAAGLLAARGDLASHRRASTALMAAMGVTVAGYLALRLDALGGFTARTQNAIRVGPVDGTLTAVALIGDYARHLVAPVNLTVVHDLAVVSTPLDARFALGALALAALCLAGWRARRNPELLLAPMLLGLPLLPALYVPALRDSLFAERYLYLPSAGATILVAFGLRRAAGTRWTALSRAAVVIAIAASAAATVRRTEAWRSDLSLWTDAVEKAPRSAVAHESLGAAQVVARRYPEAAASLSRALEIDPTRTDARVNLAIALAAVGRPGDAVAHAERALWERPRDVDAHAALGWALAGLGRFGEAVDVYEKALAIDPSRADVHNLAGIGQARLGRADVAALHFEAARRLDPGNADYARNLRLVRP